MRHKTRPVLQGRHICPAWFNQGQAIVKHATILLHSNIKEIKFNRDKYFFREILQNYVAAGSALNRSPNEECDLIHKVEKGAPGRGGTMPLFSV